MARPEKIEDWCLEAVELMARSGCSLRQAAMEMGKAVTSEECDIILRRSSFNKLLWEARHRYFNDLASNPSFKKDTAIGKLLSLAQKLEDSEEFDKAAEVMFKVGKMAGWVGVEGQVNVFGELTQKDLDRIREDLTRAKLNDAGKRPN